MSIIVETSITSGAVESSTTTNDPFTAVIDDLKKTGELGDLTILNQKSLMRISYLPTQQGRSF